MKIYTAGRIERLPLSWRERQNDNRSRRGFHVYLSRFFLDFGMLTEPERVRFLADALRDIPAVGAVYNQELEDDASFDSTDSPLCVRHQHVMKAAAVQCNSSSEHIKKHGDVARSS